MGTGSLQAADLRELTERALPGLRCNYVWSVAWLSGKLFQLLSIRMAGELDDFVRHGLVTREQALTLPPCGLRRYGHAEAPLSELVRTKGGRYRAEFDWSDEEAPRGRARLGLPPPPIGPPDRGAGVPRAPQVSTAERAAHIGLRLVVDNTRP